MARDCHLVGQTNKTRQENKARYFMPTHSLGIKDSVTPSFKLILNPQKENFQIISVPNWLSWLFNERFFFFPCWLLCVIVCIFFVTTNAFWWQVSGWLTISCPHPEAIILQQYIISCCSWFLLSVGGLWWGSCYFISPVFFPSFPFS